MVHVERYQPENLRNGRSRGPSPNGHNGSPDTSDDDCKYILDNFFKLFYDITNIRFKLEKEEAAVVALNGCHI